MILFRNHFTLITSLAFVLLLTACGGSSPKASLQTTKNSVPLWVTNPENISPLQAVGSSRVNFRGMHMQRSEAILKARDELSHRINVYLTSIYSSEIKSSNEKTSKKFKHDIIAISSLMMKNSYQIDAYIDDNERLYLLVEISDETVSSILKAKQSDYSIKLPSLQTTTFDITPLLNRRCYNQDTLKKIQTTSPMYRDRPIWFYRPNTGNIKGAIGIAERVDSSTFASQKKVAYSLAKSALAKQNQIKTNSTFAISKIFLKEETGTIVDNSISAQSVSKIKNAIIKDIWMDPKKCELYIWVVQQ